MARTSSIVTNRPVIAAEPAAARSSSDPRRSPARSRFASAIGPWSTPFTVPSGAAASRESPRLATEQSGHRPAAGGSSLGGHRHGRDEDDAAVGHTVDAGRGLFGDGQRLAGPAGVRADGDHSHPGVLAPRGGQRVGQAGAGATRRGQHRHGGRLRA